MWLELPNRPAVATPGGGKKQSTGTGPGIGISLGDLSSAKGRLKKVSSEEKKESSEGSDRSLGSQDKVTETDSFQGRMNLFKKAEGEGNFLDKFLMVMMRTMMMMMIFNGLKKKFSDTMQLL